MNAEETVPQKIDDFRVVREIGRGGMGVVYEAVEEPLGRRVALKVMHGHAVAPGMCGRFLEEARAIAKLSHASIVRVHRLGRCGPGVYLALEFVEGRSLDQLLAESRFPLPRAVNILKELAGALGHAHAQGIVHRDVKPGNVFVRADDSIVLGDFGLAKGLEPSDHNLTSPGMILGTPAYMAPEQAQGKPVSAATDVYALGVVAFEMLSGRVPFTADSAMSLLHKHVNEPPPPLLDYAAEVPRGLAALVDRMLEKDADRRPPDGKHVADELEKLLRERAPMDETMAAMPGPACQSYFEESEITAAAFELVGFAKTTVMTVLPARAAFLLESWYRLAHQAIRAEGGLAAGHVGDRVIGVFGHPQRHPDHVQRAVRAAQQLSRALASFNQAHDLTLEMRAGVACGTALVGKIAGDYGPICAQGELMGQMQRLAKSKQVPAGLRVNRAAYRRAPAIADFKPFREEDVGDCWFAPL